MLYNGLLGSMDGLCGVGNSVCDLFISYGCDIL